MKEPKELLELIVDSAKEACEEEKVHRVEIEVTLFNYSDNPHKVLVFIDVDILKVEIYDYWEDPEHDEISYESDESWDDSYDLEEECTFTSKEEVTAFKEELLAALAKVEKETHYILDEVKVVDETEGF